MKFSCKKMLSIAALSLMALSALSTTSSVSASKPYIDDYTLDTGADMGIICHTYRDVEGLVNQMLKYDNLHHNLSSADRYTLTSIKHNDESVGWHGPNPYHGASFPTLQQTMFDMSGAYGFQPGFRFGGH